MSYDGKRKVLFGYLYNILCHAVSAWAAVPKVTGDKVHFSSKMFHIYRVIHEMCEFAEQAFLRG